MSLVCKWRKAGAMGFFDKSFDPIKEAQKAAAAGAQGAVAAVAGKAGKIADGVKQGVENARAKEPDEYELAVIEYNQTYTDLESGGIELYQSRLRSIDLLNLVTDLVNSIANTPKSFVEDIEEVSHKKRSFKESESFAREELDSARKSAASVGAGVAAGMAVASIAPSAAMWVATTFGTASTGAVISTLSGAAATNAAMVWLGGDAWLLEAAESMPPTGQSPSRRATCATCSSSPRPRAPWTRWSSPAWKTPRSLARRSSSTR